MKALSRYKSPTSKKGLFQKTMKMPSNIQTIPDPVLGSFRLSKSPDNADRNLLLSHKEKLDKYRKFKKPPIDKLSGLKTCRDRFSEVGKIKCTHWNERITAKEYHEHIKSWKIEQICKFHNSKHLSTHRWNGWRWRWINRVPKLWPLQKPNVVYISQKLNGGRSTQDS